MLKLIQFPRGSRFPNMSPFCVKLETYLKIAEIAYENKFTSNSNSMPKKKLPVIDINGEKISDSYFIIQQLEAKSGKRVDAFLTDEQRAQAVFIQRTVEDSLTQALVYFRWVDEESWPKWRDKVFSRLPFPAKQVVPILVHNDLKKRMWGQGIARHSRSEIFQLIERDLLALSVTLAGKSFFFGDKPSVTDASVYGVIGNMLIEDCAPGMAERVRAHSNLVQFVARMTERFFPEYKI